MRRVALERALHLLGSVRRTLVAINRQGNNGGLMIASSILTLDEAVTIIKNESTVENAHEFPQHHERH